MSQYIRCPHCGRVALAPYGDDEGFLVVVIAVALILGGSLLLAEVLS